MKLKELKQLTYHYPRSATIFINGSNNFNMELKYDSELGWIVEIKTQDKPTN